MADIKPKKPTLKERVVELEKENATLHETIAALELTIDEKATELSKEKIMKKDMYVSQVEEECENKVANLNLVIRGRNDNLARANEKIFSLEEKLRRMQRPSLFEWLFKRKKEDGAEQ